MEIGDILQTNPESPLEILRSIPHNGFFQRYLNKVHRDGRDEMLAAHSYRHENGFTKLILGSCSKGRFKLRAHFWPAEETNVESNVHNHRFGFTSRVICGVLEHTVYEVVETGNEFRHFKYAPTASAAKYVLEYLGPAFLKEVSRERFKAGDYYSFPSIGFHTSEPKSDEPAVTLFVEDRIEATESCEVFSTRYPANDVKIDSPSMNATQWKNALKIILNLGGIT